MIIRCFIARKEHRNRNRENLSGGSDFLNTYILISTLKSCEFQKKDENNNNKKFK
ncbi:hypothetical protein AGMMS5026_10940 [Endomicrobiia bacterium]|nr:hypothetical protein AGMMS49523_01360 [Endomicrobiia bacterium]GHT10813.1 hypothetical protein AGMMS49571_00070 [Endomicrobiia bacterium]GHT20769.1 hypothetical protein AGMMS49929_08270 [Endomicrobiia bacterium]GHT25955.1 hypothetical protein AGMMS49995_01370 [Endomicrobiia bacterium]GHT32657.1 hypothetical protein AGMMS5026_10940 [Endomicrobiia bacterium]